MYRPRKSIWPCAILLTLFAETPLWASPLEFTTTDIGGGLYRYDLTLNNPFSEPLSGLNILQAGTVFGLDEFSVINAPPGWDFFAPLPPVVDELNFFSLAASTDVPVGGALSGFSFESTTDPAAISGRILFDIIGASGRQIPEPSAVAMLAIGICSLVRWRTASSSLKR